MPTGFLGTSAFMKLNIEKGCGGAVGDLVRQPETIAVSAIILPEARLVK
jgi:hypothetical protein